MTFDVETLKVTEADKRLAAFIKAESGKAPSASTVALVRTLASEYRKSPAYVAEKSAAEAAREARRKAREEKDRIALDKALAKARALAERLGVDFSTPEPSDVEPETAPVAVTVEPVAPEAEAPKRTKRPKRSRPLTVVPDPEPEEEPEVVSVEDPQNDTSAIEVVEADDFFEEESESDDDDDFFEDDDEPEDY